MHYLVFIFCMVANSFAYSFSEPGKNLFAENRQKFFAKLPENSIAIFSSAPKATRSRDTEYNYRQDSNFYYLTGFTEPDSILLLRKDATGTGKFILFTQPKDPNAEIWDGERTGQEGAKEIFGADEAFSIIDADEKIPEFLEEIKSIYFPFDRCTDLGKNIINWRKSANDHLSLLYVQLKSAKWLTAPDALVDSAKILDELRLFKSPSEIMYLERAAQVSAEAHIELMKACKAGVTEYQLASLFSHYCEMRDCRTLAYNSIVGGGKNACTLHYIENSCPLKDGDLVLVDAGSEYKFYASDITRTYPVNGKFNPEQRAIYTIVLDAQKAGIAAMQPGTPWLDVMEVVNLILAKGLLELGLLEGDLDTIMRENRFTKYTLHGLSHWMGLDVHDVGVMRANNEDRIRRLEPGMVLTIEPGIYIAPGSNVDRKWLGIGVRIEDDILITPTGNTNLSRFVPKEIDEIEQVMRHDQWDSQRPYGPGNDDDKNHHGSS